MSRLLCQVLTDCWGCWSCVSGAVLGMASSLSQQLGLLAISAYSFPNNSLYWPGQDHPLEAPPHPGASALCWGAQVEHLGLKVLLSFSSL